MRIRLASLALLGALALATGGCGLYYGVARIFTSPPRLKTEGPIPSDFRIGIKVHDVADPPVDYEITIDRAGKGTYDVTVRQPRRRHAEGVFEVSDDQVVGLWHRLVDVKFGDLEDRYPGSGDGQDLAAGGQRFYVFGGGAEKAIETYYETNETLDSVRAAIVAVVPREFMQARGTGAGSEGPKSFVGDTQTQLFHLPDCPALKDVPEERRRPLATWYDALDFRFQPCPDCHPSPPGK